MKKFVRRKTFYLYGKEWIVEYDLKNKWIGFRSMETIEGKRVRVGLYEVSLPQSSRREVKKWLKEKMITDLVREIDEHWPRIKKRYLKKLEEANKEKET